MHDFQAASELQYCVYSQCVVGSMFSLSVLFKVSKNQHTFDTCWIQNAKATLQQDSCDTHATEEARERPSRAAKAQHRLARQLLHPIDDCHWWVFRGSTNSVRAH